MNESFILMQLKKIEYYLNLYKDFLLRQESVERLFAWESQKIFQDHWDIDAHDFGEMYDRSLENSQTRRLWKREHYEPKRLMLEFIALEPEMVRQAFQNLFNEEKDIEARVDRFVFYCDELLRAYKEKYPRSVENNHYHGDNYAMISLYLAFRYPDKYTLYDHEAFRKLLQLLGSGDIPQAADFARFSKIMRTLYTFLQKKPELLELHQKRLDPRRHLTRESFLLVWDFYQFCVRSA